MSAPVEIAQVISRSRTIPILGTGLVIIAITISSAGILDKITQQLLFTFGGLIILLGTSLEMLNYLQSAKKVSFPPPEIELGFISSEVDPLKDQIQSLQKEIVALQKQSQGAIFSKEDKDQALLIARDRLTNDVIGQLSKYWEGKYKETSFSAEVSSFVDRIAEDTRRRLQQEVFTLGRRANLNLVIGAMVSLFGIGLLWYFIAATTVDIVGGVATTDIAIRFAIRFSLVVVIQIFAYFFLRLYRYSIFETKYFQNEITNVDFKLIGLKSAILTDDKKLIGSICNEITKTERNFILKKGQTTVSLRRDEMEIQYENNLLAKVERIFAIKKAKDTPEGD
ncbi:hypothetical protein [Methylobacterium haplocladii]|uniref:Uncharacterized protein n=1 Tax=Methylobacterium haplocladii TaxID=1176176 RepID=A0A512IJH8_9HYPH|nr:hypothetical protein [Methylobacterium haplocladii]GEO97832.1 hypothetical protein MHA02_02200 [Methylobacterium haplocladii]GJD82678.1 hypothetical protein HPGCJGGD_0537 [Methylobacterium haplocladii]GLS57535.1 hypothetical protein GCM10007887_01900 [Methylobacterium haplocladii]